MPDLTWEQWTIVATTAFGAIGAVVSVFGVRRSPPEWRLHVEDDGIWRRLVNEGGKARDVTTETSGSKIVQGLGKSLGDVGKNGSVRFIVRTPWRQTERSRITVTWGPRWRRRSWTDEL